MRFGSGRGWHAAWMLGMLVATAMAGMHAADPATPPTKPSADKAPGTSKEPGTNLAKDPLLAKAIERFRNADFDDTLAAIREAAAKNPMLPPPQLLLAQLFAQANHPLDGRLALEKAVLESPDDPEAYVYLAEVALPERRITEADLLLQKAAGLVGKLDAANPRHNAIALRVELGRAAVAEARENWPLAKQHLQAALAIESKSSNALQRLARVLFFQKQYREALAKLQAAAALEPGVPAAEATLARWYEAAGDHDQAVTWMKTAVGNSPKDFLTLISAAQWAMERDDYDHARKFVASALEVKPDSLEAKNLLGIVCMLARDFSAAEDAFQDILQKQATSYEASNNLALTLVEQDDNVKRQRALEYAQLNARQYPKRPEALSTLGWVYYRNGRLDEAEQALKAAASMPPVSRDTAYYLARIALDRNRPAEARQWLRMALQAKGFFTLRKPAQELLDSLK